MRKLQNTLYITTQGSYLHKERETLVVEQERKKVGFLHADRPGRDSLAQDILEEFRAWWADRLVLSLINRGQIKPQAFVTEASDAVSLKADARKLLFQALQAKKQEKIVHPFLGEEVEIGLLPYIQAMLLARHLRGDLAEYPPFLMR
jgi:CRISPR-associated protein Cas1